VADFVTLAAVKTRLGLVGTKEDAKISQAVASVNASILGYLCLDTCDPTTYTVTADIDCDDDLRRVDTVWIEMAPVVSVSEVKNGGRVVLAANYTCRATRIRLCCDTWCCGCRAAEVTLSAGFDAGVPKLANQLAVIQDAAVDWAVMKYRGGGDPGLKRERLSRSEWEKFDVSKSVGNGFAWWPDSLKDALLPFWRPESGIMLTREC